MSVIAERIPAGIVLQDMGKFLVWCILLLLCWPLALLALVVYPLVWILLIPFRIVGIAVDGVLGAVRGVVMLPGQAGSAVPSTRIPPAGGNGCDRVKALPGPSIKHRHRVLGLLVLLFAITYIARVLRFSGRAAHPGGLAHRFPSAGDG
jgi:hypothetical protein